MKKFLSLILIFNLLCIPVFALELDTSVDDEIRKNYNPSKLEDDVELPPLPKILNTKRQEVSEVKAKSFAQPSNVIKPTNVNYSNPKPAPILEHKTVAVNTQQNCTVIKKGTRIRLKLKKKISDGTRKGTKVEFESIYPVSTTYLTIPAGTIFRGDIIKTHPPQLSGNGGLIVININSFVLNDEIQPISAFVVRANSKFVYYNKIKGKRKYISSSFRSIKPGCDFFRKMLGVGGNLAQDGSSIILTPFAYLLGTVALASNVVISPALGVFQKGGHIIIGEGSIFKIKLSQDAYIYY